MDTAQINELQAFAVAHYLSEFAHLCNTARQQLENPDGEQWAVERIAPVVECRPDWAVEQANGALDYIKRMHLADQVARRSHSSELWAWGARMLRIAGVNASSESTVSWALNDRRLPTRLELIRATDTTRPDGAIARRIEV